MSQRWVGLTLLTSVLLVASACGDEGLSGVEAGGMADAPGLDAVTGDDGGDGAAADAGGGAGGDGLGADAAGTSDAAADGGAPGDAPSDVPEPPADGAGPADATAPDVAGADVGSPDGGAQTCTEPAPFVPPGPPTGWNHTTTELFTVTQGPPNHRGQDVVAGAGEPQVLIGKFAYGLLDKDLKGEDVEVFIQDAPPCGPWASLGSAVTSQDGEHGSTYGIQDDGGRVFFEVPAGSERPVGRYPVRMLVHGDNSVAAFTLFVVEPGTGGVVFDIDGTLTTADFELVKELFAEIFLGSYVPELREGAVEVVETWAGKGYLPVYLTGRPDTLRAASEGWLRERGFPEGAVHLTDTNAQALPTSGGVAAYKTDFLTLVGASLDLYAAYGNATTDIEAYGNVDIPKGRTFIIGDNAGVGGTVAVPSYPEHLPAAEAMPLPPVPAPPATGTWP